MAPNLVTLLRRLADMYEEEEKGETSQATMDRIAALEERIAAESAPDRRDALEDLSDDELELIRQHREQAAAPIVPPAAPDPEPVEDSPEVKTRPGRRSGRAYKWTVDDAGEVQRLDIPMIYNGPDEDERVPLVDPEADADADDAADVA